MSLTADDIRKKANRAMTAVQERNKVRAEVIEYVRECVDATREALQVISEPIPLRAEGKRQEGIHLASVQDNLYMLKSTVLVLVHDINHYDDIDIEHIVKRGLAQKFVNALAAILDSVAEMNEEEDRSNRAVLAMRNTKMSAQAAVHKVSA